MSVVVVLGPADSLQDVGFEVSEGDRLRARVFVREDGPAYAQKVMNLTRRTMLQLRTLRQVPLWNASGRWEGGPARTRPGGPGSGRGRRPNRR